MSSLVLSLKVFKQEAESHLWAVDHNIPKGFLHGLAAVSVSPSFCHSLCITQPSLSSAQSWERADMLKM